MSQFFFRVFMLAAAAAALSGCGSADSHSQFADASAATSAAVVVTDVRVDALPGGINPDAIARKVSGKVYLGSNPCQAGDAKAKLVAAKVGKNIEVTAIVEGSDDAINRICTADYNPVFANVSVVVRAMQSEVAQIVVKNVDEMGKDQVIFRGKATSVVGGKFKLYAKPRHQADPNCDIHTLLVLSEKRGAMGATMTEGVDGVCEIYIAPKRRSYTLASEQMGCGSFKYEGSRLFQMHESLKPTDAVKIEIVDHRGRICRDLVPAPIITTETLANGKTIVKYSN